MEKFNKAEYDRIRAPATRVYRLKSNYVISSLLYALSDRLTVQYQQRVCYGQWNVTDKLNTENHNIIKFNSSAITIKILQALIVLDNTKIAENDT